MELKDENDKLLVKIEEGSTSSNGRNEVTKDSSSHNSRLEVEGTSSEGKALDYNEPVRKNTKHDNYRHLWGVYVAPVE